MFTIYYLVFFALMIIVPFLHMLYILCICWFNTTFCILLVQNIVKVCSSIHRTVWQGTADGNRSVLAN